MIARGLAPALVVAAACVGAAVATSSTAAPSGRPIPEYTPSRAVLLSSDLLEFDYEAAALIRAIVDAKADAWIAFSNKPDKPSVDKKLISSGLQSTYLKNVRAVRLPHGNIWLRDFGPLFVAAGGSARPLLLDLAYPDATSPENDRFPAALATMLGWPRVSVPLALDGGAFLAARDFCFTSAADLPDSGSTRTASAKGAFQSFLGKSGCPRLLNFPTSPHAHVDMWMKVISDDTVLVNQIDEETLAAARTFYGTIPADVLSLRDSLDTRANELTQYLKVERLPMPLPYRGAFRSYANAALVNDVAILPSFSRFGWNYDDYPDHALKESYEERVKLIYAKHGFRAQFVRADGLIHNGGAFHCVLLQIPSAKQSPL